MEISDSTRVEQVAAVISGIFTRRVSLVANARLRELAIWTLTIILFTPSVSARQSQTGNTPGTSAPGWPITNPMPGHGLVIPDPTDGMQNPETARMDDSCSLWDVAVKQGPTVSAARLEVPGKARREYGKGCGDLRGGKLEGAEEHLRKAVQEYPRYAAAWVLLGEVLETARRLEDARDACAHGSSADSNYAPAYLCLADVAAQKEEWNQALDLAGRSFAVYPVQNVYGCFYTAIAQFHLSQLPAAEKAALVAIDLDRAHRVPRVHLLLAQIYMAKHDSNDAAAQLRAYLKVAPNSPVSAGVRKSLVELEGQIPK